MVYRIQLTFDEFIELLDVIYIPSKRVGFFLQPGMYEVTDTNKTLEHILPDNVKVTITIDDLRLKSNLNINQNLIFKKKFFYFAILDFTQSYSGVLGTFESLKVFLICFQARLETINPLKLQALIKIN